MRLYIEPDYNNDIADPGDGGIRRVVEAQKRFLPDYGVTIVKDVALADVVAVHAGSRMNVDKPLVSHCHGLYWQEYQWPNWAYDLNKKVIDSLRSADIVTAPSKWVANSLRRGMWLDPTVLYHGIDLEEWPMPPASTHEGYVLWNKTRVDNICDPTPLSELARHAPDVPFVSTFGASDLPNLKLTGKLPFAEAKKLIRNAAVYLCTTRETFGIGTLEAMACGVPILGWAWGGQAEFIEHKVNGWLCTPGDVASLVEGLRYCLANREQLGAAARATVEQSFTWPKVMAEYVKVYERATLSHFTPVKVSVVIPCYNLSAYLPAAVESVATQNFKDVEVVIVNDHSTDDSLSVARTLAEQGPVNIRVIDNPQNLYLAGALNAGIEAARGKYILPLDADNMLAAPNTLETMSRLLDTDRSIDIAYANFNLLEPDGRVWRSSWPPATFSYIAQIAHRNQLPSSSMYRKKVWQRAGGYRRRCRTAEDADFWCRVSSLGANAKKVEGLIAFTYRNRDDSMSHTVPEWDWAAWYPWTKYPALTPFAAPIEKPNVPSYEPIVVSVVIPVGPGHEEYLIDALDSLFAQTFQNWEAVVINDTGKPFRSFVHPWARVVTTEGGGKGPAIARNLGVAHAKGRFILFLDADDYLQPTAIATLVATQQQYGGYVYSDWYEQENGKLHQVPDYTCAMLLTSLPHTITALIPTSMFKNVGGFDEVMQSWEDWDLFLKLANADVCGVRVPQPLLYYRLQSGMRREMLVKDDEIPKSEMFARWGDYLTGRKQLMACGSCGGGGGVVVNSRAVPRHASASVPTDGDMVLLEYIGGSGSVSIRNNPSGVTYRFGADASHRVSYVHKIDAARLLTMEKDFRLANVDNAVVNTPELEAAGPPAGY